jgi:hypothetical protein
MSLFRKLVKGSGQNNSGSTTGTLSTTEEKSKNSRLEEQIKHLNNYIQQLVKENEVL